jgi:hypothetical protein
MKTIICGSRHFDNYPFMRDILHQIVFDKDFPLQITEVVCGMAQGADLLGKYWAERRDIPVKEFPADWNRYKKGAGAIRNRQMGAYGDATIAFLYPDSRGTADMIKVSKQLDLLLYVVYVDKAIWVREPREW